MCWIHSYVVESLSIQSKGIVRCKLGYVRIEHLDLLVPNSESLQSELSKLSSSLKYLTINGWVPESDLTDFKSLETIKILTKVDPRFKSQIDSLKTKKMVVTYESPPDIPDEPNLIFDLLNDDCILEILSFLTVPQWMTFGEVHPRAEWVVTNYKYHRTPFTLANYRDSRISDNHLFNICPFVSNIELEFSLFIEYPTKFTQLTALTLLSFTITKEMVVKLPDELEELRLGNSYEKGLDLSPYFARINSTLRVLELDSLPKNAQFLMELKELREIKMNVEIGCDHFPCFIKQNTGLERVHIGSGISSDYIRRETWNAIECLPKLKDLRLNCWDFMSDNMLGFFEKIGPQLKKLFVVINDWDNITDLHNLDE